MMIEKYILCFSIFVFTIFFGMVAAGTADAQFSGASCESTSGDVNRTGTDGSNCDAGFPRNLRWRMSQSAANCSLGQIPIISAEQGICFPTTGKRLPVHSCKFMC